MSHYVATFHTHLSAMRSSRNIVSRAENVSLAPVPRTLSSSCGTCLRYTAEDTLAELMDKDLESIALQVAKEQYQVVYKVPELE